MIPTVTISARGEARLQAGHPWIYRADLGDVHATGGDRVLVRNGRGRALGHAFYSDRSQIALRMLTRGDDAADDALIRRRIEAAIAFRQTLAIDASACRLIHGEADLLPSLVVDRYGDYLVVQTMSQGTDRLMPLIVSTLRDIARPAGILARNDPRTRALEGLEQKVEVLDGEVPETIAVTENGVHYDVDVRRGQKTGLFLDQRENRSAAALYAKGRLLDCFTYHGGFALALAARCEQVLAFDVSADAIERDVPGRRDHPRCGLVGHALDRPARGGPAERLLHRLLGQIGVAEPAHPTRAMAMTAAAIADTRRWRVERRRSTVTRCTRPS